MKKVLIIYPHWPPSNLVGVHRVRLIVNELRDCGWEPIVLTVDERDYEEDGALGSEVLVNENVEVVKVRARPPLYFMGKRLVGDIGLRGWYALRREAERILKKGNIDFMWFSLPSWYPCLFASSLKQRHGVPYAIDYQDPWIHEPASQYGPFHRTRLTVRLAKWLEPRVLLKASFISAINEAYMAGPIQRTPNLEGKPNVALQLGFSEKDHTRPVPQLQTPWPEGKRALLYAGAYWEQGAPLFDNLLKAWSLAKTSGELPEDAHLIFIGTGNPLLKALQSKINDLGIEQSATEFPDRIPYLHVLELLRRTHGTVILGSTAKHYSASKVFQLLIAGKPILAHLHPESEARQILNEAHANDYFSPFQGESNSADIQQLNQQILRLFKGEDWSPDLSAIQSHSAHHAASKLTVSFETCLQR